MYRHRKPVEHQAAVDGDSTSSSQSIESTHHQPFYPSRNPIRTRPRSIHNFQDDSEEFYLDSIGATSSSSPFLSSSDSDSIPKSSKKIKPNNKRLTLLLSLSLISISTLCFLYFKYLNSLGRTSNFRPSNPQSTSSSSSSTPIKTKESAADAVVQQISDQLPPGVHLYPQSNKQNQLLPELPLQYHRPPLLLQPFLYPPTSKRRSVQSIKALEPTLDNQECSEAWIGRGEICEALKVKFGNGDGAQDGETSSQSSIEAWKDRKVDVVWTWVNGSDSRHQVSRRMYHSKPFGSWADNPTDPDFFQKMAMLSKVSIQKRANDPTKRPPQAPKFKVDDSDNRFRESDELKESMRTSVFHLGNQLGTMHIISPDYAAPAELQDQDRKRSEGKRETQDQDVNHRRVKNSAAGRLEVRAPIQDLPPFKFPSDTELASNESSDFFRSKENGILRMGQLPIWLDSLHPDVAVGERARLRNSVSSTQVKEFRVRVHHDWDVFTYNFLLNPDREMTKEEEEEEMEEVSKWKKEVLPTFNSMAVESMMGDLTGLSEDFISSNDDFFFGRNLSISDFNSPLYGLIFHFQPDLLVGSTKPGSPPSLTGNGEWPGLNNAGWLLSQRFGKRDRPYVAHVHRAYSRPLLLEMRMIWGKEFFEASKARWRGEGGRDIVNQFLFSHFVIERHREALLWGFLVGRIDRNGDGLLDELEYDEALRLMGISEKAMKFWKDSLANPHDNPLPNLKIPVRLPQRSTLSPNQVSDNFRSIGMSEFKQTNLTFSSQDGYPFLMGINPYVQSNPPAVGAGQTSIQLNGGKEYEPYPHFVPTEKTKYRFGEDLQMLDPMDRPNPNGAKAAKASMLSNSLLPDAEPVAGGASVKKPSRGDDFKKAACSIDLNECLVRHFVRGSKVQTQDVFKKFAFEEQQCGDCLLLQLLRKSGQSGFSAFLPSKGQLFPAQDHLSPLKSFKSAPHLPLTKISGTAASEEKDDDGQVIEQPDFSLKAVGKSTGWENGDMRDFSRRLIARYTYGIGDTPIRFLSLQNPIGSMALLRDLGENLPALYALNDDLGDRAGEGFMKYLVHSLLDGRYPKMDFEL